MKSKKPKNSDEIEYKNYKNLIYKLAWYCHSSTGIEVEEIVSELNVVFCEAITKFDHDRGFCFSTFLVICCKNKIHKLIKKHYCLKNQNIVYTDIESEELTCDPMESIVIYDAFINNENPIIQAISRILAIYNIPAVGIKPRLREILKKYYNYKSSEINNAIIQLKTIYDL